MKVEKGYPEGTYYRPDRDHWIECAIKECDIQYYPKPSDRWEFLLSEAREFLEEINSFDKTACTGPENQTATEIAIGWKLDNMNWVMTGKKYGYTL